MIYKELLSYFKKYKVKFSLLNIFNIFSVVMGIVPPLMTKYIVDDLIKESQPQLIGIAVLIMIGVTVLKGIIDYFVRLNMEYIGQNVIHNLRTDLFNHLNKLSFSFYDNTKTGDLISRVTADAEFLKRFFGFAALTIISNILTLIAIFIVMFTWSYKLTIIYLLIIPLIIHAMRNYAYKVNPVFGKSRKSLGKLTDVVKNSVLGMETIKLFGREDWEFEQFSKENNKYYNVNIKGNKITSVWLPYVNFIIGLGTALVICIGGYLVIKNEITLGILVGLITYMRMLIRPIRQTGMMISMIAKSDAVLKRIFAILKIEPEIKDDKNAVNLSDVKGKIEFKNVSFGYKDNNTVLHNINFKIEPGEKIAVVGPTGTGKTTLIQLLLRFYDADEGQILIDNYDIKKLKLNSLRKQIGIVMQDVFIFSSSIAENIAYGRPNSSRKEIVEAAKEAKIHDFITTLKDGYETQVGERGIKLSGGQKQRLAIARVLLNNPKIIIMDEPTSNVDAQTELNLNETFEKFSENKTLIIIAHRLWTVKKADKIIVLKDGNIVEMGKHEELLMKNSYYKKMYNDII
jgi:ABC-type multidrug transport system fused ATPase/permease subunit